MNDDARVDIVGRQYQRWRYPRPVEDLEAWSVHNWDLFDPLYARGFDGPTANINLILTF